MFNPAKKIKTYIDSTVQTKLKNDQERLAQQQEAPKIIVPGAFETPKSIAEEPVLASGANKLIPVHFVANKAGIEHTLIIGLKYILPEDLLWRKNNPRVPAMICLQENNQCACTYNCMYKFATRCHWLFERYAELRQIMVVFSREEGNLIRKEPKYGLLKQELEATGLSKLESSRTEVPRLWIIHIDRNMDIHVRRARRDFYKRLNFDGLQTSLRRSKKRQIETPPLW